MALFNQLRVARNNDGYHIEYITGSLFKRWKAIKRTRYEFTKSPDDSLELVDIKMNFDHKSWAEDYIKKCLTATDIRDISMEVLLNLGKVRLVKYIADDGVFYHWEEKRKRSEEFVAVDVWRFDDEASAPDFFEKSIINQCEMRAKYFYHVLTKRKNMAASVKRFHKELSCIFCWF